MSRLQKLLGTVAVATILAIPPIAWASGRTAMEKAIEKGARQLNSDEIAELVVGKTVTVSLGKKQFHFYYSRDNVLSGKLIGGDGTFKGYYGITDDDRVCVSMAKDKGRLRCMSLLEMDGTVKKYDTAGKVTFVLIEFQEGKKL